MRVTSIFLLSPQWFILCHWGAYPIIWGKMNFKCFQILIEPCFVKTEGWGVNAKNGYPGQPVQSAQLEWNQAVK